MTSPILGQFYLSPIFSDFTSQNIPGVDYTKFFGLVFRYRHVLGQNIEQGRFSWRHRWRHERKSAGTIFPNFSPKLRLLTYLDISLHSEKSNDVPRLDARSHKSADKTAFWSTPMALGSKTSLTLVYDRKSEIYSSLRQSLLSAEVTNFRFARLCQKKHSHPTRRRCFPCIIII